MLKGDVNMLVLALATAPVVVVEVTKVLVIDGGSETVFVLELTDV